MADLDGLVKYLDGYLDVANVADAPVAMNGLQVANNGRVTRVAAAVDASERTIREAIARGCDLLVVHHGLFWDGAQPVTGRRYRKLQALLASNVALYSAHLPLDVHEEVGNNAVLARELGIEVAGRFGGSGGGGGRADGGPGLGVWGHLEVKREVLAARLDDVLGARVRMLAFGPEVVRRVGVITGGAGSMISSALDAGLDAFVTGEGAHHTYFDAEELGINVFFGGHYATETWGVRALARHIEDRFGLPWEFIDFPTGM